MYDDVRARRRAHTEDESYFVSLSDLMAGVLFLFIIMLAYFGLELQKSADLIAGRSPAVDRLKLDTPKPAPAAPPTPLSGYAPRDPRLDIMDRLDDLLRAGHVRYELDEPAGVLRFHADTTFDAAGGLTPQGRAAMVATAQALRAVLPCYSFSAALPKPGDCPTPKGRIGAVFVEGHVRGGTPDAWGLSLRQAAAAFGAVTAAQPALTTLTSQPGGAGANLLGVSGYGPSRPLVGQADAAANSRLEIHIAMAAE